jgi:hypothetical protein
MSRALAATVGSLALTAASFAEQPVQWRAEDGGNGHWYQFVRFNGGVLYPFAKSFCEARGGHLVTIRSAAEHGFTCSILGALECWIGAEKVGDSWTWCTGETWDYGDQYFCSMVGGDRFQLYGCYCWNDTYDNDCCTGALIIEWDSDCNSDGIVDFGQILAGQLRDTNSDGVPDVCQPLSCAHADFNHDLSVDGSDLQVLLSQWGPASTTDYSDLNHDGRVDGDDLGLLLSFWGSCPN